MDTLARQVTLACLLEVAAAKPGNITPAHDFPDTTYLDMVRAGLALGGAFAAERVRTRSVGELIADGVRATAAVSAGNPNLGIVLLFAPLARAHARVNGSAQSLRDDLRCVLGELGLDDARAAFAAIVSAAPGGLGDAPEHDVRTAPQVGLREAMAAAADRDRVAAEYAYGYPVVFDHAVPWLAETLAGGARTLDAILILQLRLLAEFPDTLIARKAGPAAARTVSADARTVLTGGCAPDALAEFDASLRVDGHRLNPGTTADLVAATLLVALLTGMPLR